MRPPGPRSTNSPPGPKGLIDWGPFVPAAESGENRISPRSNGWPSNVTRPVTGVNPSESLRPQEARGRMAATTTIALPIRSMTTSVCTTIPDAASMQSML